MVGFATPEEASAVLDQKADELQVLDAVVGTGVGHSSDEANFVIHLFVRSEEDVARVEQAAASMLGGSRFEVIVSGEITAFDSG